MVRHTAAVLQIGRFNSTTGQENSQREQSYNWKSHCPRLSSLTPVDHKQELGLKYVLVHAYVSGRVMWSTELKESISLKRFFDNGFSGRHTWIIKRPWGGYALPWAWLQEHYLKNHSERPYCIWEDSKWQCGAQGQLGLLQRKWLQSWRLMWPLDTVYLENCFSSTMAVPPPWPKVLGEFKKAQSGCNISRKALVSTAPVQVSSRKRKSRSPEREKLNVLFINEWAEDQACFGSCFCFTSWPLHLLWR